MNTKTTTLGFLATLVSAFGLNLHGASTLQFEFNQYSATEDSPSVLVAVIRTGDLSGTASVDVASFDLQANAGEDYEATSLTLEFPDGEEVRTFRVPLLNDGAKEVDEWFRLTLSHPSAGSTLGAKQLSHVTLKDTDPGVQFTWKHFWGYEVDGALSVEVERGNDENLSAFAVDYATSDGTALAGQDYTAITGTLQFAEGEMTKTITISVIDDAETESREQFRIGLFNTTGPGGIGGNSAATLYLYDTTGHEPRRFGPVQATSGMFGSRSVEVPLLGRQGGSNQDWFELFCVEHSENVVHWMPETWIACSQTELPAAYEYLYYNQHAESWYAPVKFFRIASAPLVAAWPPPQGDEPFVQADRAGDIHRGVGYTERWMTDPTRRNRYGISDNSSFRVSIWYPGSPQPGAVPKRLMGAWAFHLWMDNYDYSSALPAPNMTTYSFADAPFLDGAETHPIILYSGMGYPGDGSSREVSQHAEYLASQGYVVVAPDHFDCWETELADGSHHGSVNPSARSAAGFRDRMRDFEVLLEALPQWQESDPILRGRLDLSRLASLGFHWGAGVAAELCRTVEACQVGVLMNVGNWSLTGADVVLREGPGKPMMFIQQSAVVVGKDLYGQMASDAVWFQIADSNYASLYTWAHWDNAALNRVAQDRAVSRTVHAYIGSLLADTFDRGGNPVLWRGPSDDYPNVINYQRK